MEIKRKFLTPPKESFFLFGPRGTGKSTWIKQHYPKALYLDLLLPDKYRNYSAHPERFIELVRGNQGKSQMVIDEVQKIPELLGVVHRLIEDYPEKQFILTGSSARKLKKSGTNLLGGRAQIMNLHPFVAAELDHHFSLESALKNGMIPLVWNAKNPEKTLHAYINLYLKEEIQSEGLTRNAGNFSRFLESISFSHASILNLNNVAQDCGVNRKTVENYVTILEDLLLAFFVPVFSRRAKRATVSHPKFYFFDSGVYSALKPAGPLDVLSEKEGASLEGLVAQHLRAWIDYSQKNARLYYWRTRGGSEVDFVCYGEQVFLAIEVKNSTQVHKQDIRHLQTFALDYPECTPLLLYRGTDSLLMENVKIIPCEKFLKDLFDLENENLLTKEK